MADEAAQKLLGVSHRGAVGGVEDAVVALAEPFEAGHEPSHVAVGRDHHGGRPAHHVVAGEQDIAISVAQVVGGMPRSHHRDELLAVAKLDRLAIG